MDTVARVASSLPFSVSHGGETAGAAAGGTRRPRFQQSQAEKPTLAPPWFLRLFRKQPGPRLTTVVSQAHFWRDDSYTS